MARRVSRKRQAKLESSKKKVEGSYGGSAFDDQSSGELRLSTGSLGMDELTGGGIPMGKITLLWGVESGGKTLVAQKVVASAQGTCTKCKTPIEHQPIMPPRGSSDKEAKEHREGVIQCPHCYTMYHKDLAPPLIYADMPGVEPEDTEGMDPDTRYCAKCGEHLSIEEFLPAGDVSDFELATSGPFRCECGACEPMIVSWLDFERTFDPKWSEDTGVITDELLYKKPSYGEEGLEVALQLIIDGAADVIVIDSVAGIVSHKELQDSLHDSNMGKTARLMASFLRKWEVVCAEAKRTHDIEPTLILINQVREKIGVTMGSPSRS